MAFGETLRMSRDDVLYDIVSEGIVSSQNFLSFQYNWAMILARQKERRIPVIQGERIEFDASGTKLRGSIWGTSEIIHALTEKLVVTRGGTGSTDIALCIDDHGCFNLSRFCRSSSRAIHSCYGGVSVRRCCPWN